MIIVLNKDRCCSAASEDDISNSRTILEAIATRRCFDATYNRTRFRLAPQILYTRHGEPYLDAVPLAKDGRAPRESKVASFKVTGLADLEIVPQPTAQDPAFDPADPRYQGTTLFSLAS